MYFVTQRIDRILTELKKLSYSNEYLIDNIKMKEGYFHTIEEADNSGPPWTNFGQNELWGGSDVYCWFRSEFVVPKDMEGKKLVFNVETDTKGWDAINPQFLVFINGELIQGYDVNHSETTLSINAKAGDTYIFDLQAYGGATICDEVVSTARCLQSVTVLETDIEKLYYDIQVPLEVTKLLGKEDKNRLNIENYLENAINMLDMRKHYSKEFKDSVKMAIEYLQEEFYDKYCGDKNIIAKCVGHTHIDVAWLWDLDQTRKKVQRSFATVLRLMEEYPEYIFMSSQPQLYQYLKEERPQLYEKVKEKIAQGKWEAEGGMWVEADCNVSSGEALVRQIIHGKRFFREEFGVDNKILWLPDVFGYNDALPQILKKSGIDYFMTTKISWSEYNKMPYDTFNWVGLDGSEVLTHFITTIDYNELPDRYLTTYNGFINVPSVKGAWERYQQKGISDEVLISFGYGDGGGGPTKDMLETAKRLEKGIPGCPAVEMSTSLDFFNSIAKKLKDNPKLPRWVGELYLEYHRGTLTTMARNKRYNRKSEFLYEEVEWLSSISSLLNNGVYPKDIIKKCWEIICLNQFHDIIPGSSIKKVYEDSKKQYIKILDIGNIIKDKTINSISLEIQVDSTSVVVFNPSSFTRDEIVSYEIEGQSKSFYATDIPAKGYRAYPICDIIEQTKEISISTKSLENRFYKIELDDDANITSIYDKTAKREVIKQGHKGNVIQAFEDKPHANDAWDINIYYQQKMWEVNDLQSIRVVEDSEFKATLEIKRRFLDSTIVQKMSIYRDTPRIDFDTTIDWKEKQVLLKACFPVDIHSEKATYDIQFGNVERPTHWNTSWDMAKFEVCGHKWADLSEAEYGVSLLNDCKYGYDIKEGVMRLTLLKSPISPNEDADREMHYFTYSLFPHQGDWRKANTVQMGYRLNQPVTSILVDKQKGTLPTAFSFVNIDSKNVIMEVVKQAEESDNIILRVYECYNKRTNSTINFFKDIKTVYECDLEERQNIAEIKPNGKSFKFTIKPYEIKTFKLVL